MRTWLRGIDQERISLVTNGWKTIHKLGTNSNFRSFKGYSYDTCIHMYAFIYAYACISLIVKHHKINLNTGKIQLISHKTLPQAETRLQQEVARVAAYLHPSTEEKLLKVCISLSLVISLSLDLSLFLSLSLSHTHTDSLYVSLSLVLSLSPPPLYLCHSLGVFLCALLCCVCLP